MAPSHTPDDERRLELLLQCLDVSLRLLLTPAPSTYERVAVGVGETRGEGVFCAVVKDDQAVEALAAPRQNLLVARTTRQAPLTSEYTSSLWSFTLVWSKPKKEERRTPSSHASPLHVNSLHLPHSSFSMALKEHVSKSINYT